MPWETILPHALFVLFSIALAVLAVVIVVPIVKSQKAAGGVVNYDTYWTEYLFFVPCKKEAFVRQMHSPHADDTMEYTFDESAMTIKLSRWNASDTYDLFVRECEGGCYIRLHKQRLILSKNTIPYFVNEFMIKKFGAEPLPYEQYPGYVRIMQIQKK